MCVCVCVCACVRDGMCMWMSCPIAHPPPRPRFSFPQIIKSEGDAMGAKIVADATSKYGTGLLEIRRIETAKSVAETLARARGNVTYLPGAQDGHNGGGSSILLNVPTN